MLPLLEAVDEKSLVAAIKKDPYLQSNHAALIKRISAHDGWEPILEELQKAIDYSGFDSFGLGGVKESTGQVALRLPFVAARCGMCPNDASTLGLWVDLSPELRGYARDDDAIFQGSSTVRIH